MRWPSDRTLLKLPDLEYKFDACKGKSNNARIGTSPHLVEDKLFWLHFPKRVNPAVAVFDCHPSIAPSIQSLPRIAHIRRMWSWTLGASAYGEPRSRSRVIIVSSRVTNALADNMSPLYIFDVKLPAPISEYMRSHDGFLEGSFMVCPKDSVYINQPTPVGWISLLPGKPTFGSKTDKGVISKVSDGEAIVPTKGGKWVNRDNLRVLPTKYQVYSNEGVTFPW